MGMTSRDIVDLISSPSPNRGKLMFLGAGKNAQTLTRSQRQFVAEFSSTEAPKKQVLAHPARAGSSTRDDGPLTAAELAWLQRFPSPVDPETVSFEDARALATLAAKVPAMKHPADARLVAAVWAPVREFHDRRAVEAELSNANAPLPNLPSSALNALADAVATEFDQLTTEEAITRAGAMLDAAASRRQELRDQAISTAQRRHQELEARTSERTEITREHEEATA